MAITSITIENFKCIGDAVTIPIRPVTLLFGKNSAGKSTVLHALHYMREVCEDAGADPDRTRIGGKYIDLGGFRSLVHLHELDRKIRIRIEFDLASEESKNLNRFLEHKTNPDSMWIEVITSWNENNVYTESYEYGLNGTEWIRFTPTERVEVKHSDTVDLDDTEWHQLGNYMLLNIKHPDIKDTTGDYLKKISGIPFSMWSGIPLQELRDIRHLGPMRETPSRDYRPQLTPEEALWMEGLEAWNTLGRNPQLIKRINHYMRDVLKMGYTISRQEITMSLKDDESKEQSHDPLEKYRTVIIIKLYDEKNNIYLDLADVGLGISQVTPVLVGASHGGRPDPNRNYLNKPPGGFFMVEEPELHLHPASQVALGDVFIDCIRNPVRELKEAFESPKEKSDKDNHKVKEYADKWMQFMKENRDHPHLKKLIESTGENRLDKAAVAILRMFANNIVEYEKFSNDLLRGRTLLIETHSEHLLLRLLRRVRETTKGEQTDYILTPDDLSIVYVVPTSERVEFIPLNVMDDGDFDGPWPEGFFDERLEELL